MQTSHWLLASCAALMATAVGAQAPVVADGERILWHTDAGTAHQLRIAAPDGQVLAFDFGAGRPVELSRAWQDGRHAYELRVLAAESRTRGDDDIAGAPAAAGATGPAPAHTGSFLVEHGRIVAAHDGDIDDGEPEATAGEHQPHATRDQVIPDDLIVQGSICTGFDCVNNEDFGFDTLRLKENNTRIHFADTSANTGYPARSWEIIANDSASGGLEYLGFIDRGTGRRPFWLRADAPADALVIAANGRVGLRTGAPQLDLHMVTGDTPAIRFEQTTAGGFIAQTWDVAGNEANFFVRDLTAGSQLPLRIQPGAPTSTLSLLGNGNVGLGRWTNAAAKLDIYRAEGDEPLLRVQTGPSNEAVTQMELDATGNLRVNGTISQLSSRLAKTNFVAVDASELLARVAQLPISVWNYIHQPDDVRHLGPVAEDFHAAFGLGERPTEIAPGDMAGVALAAVQALNAQVAERDARIAELEARLQRLEAHLDAATDR